MLFNRKKVNLKQILYTIYECNMENINTINSMAILIVIDT